MTPTGHDPDHPRPGDRGRDDEPRPGREAPRRFEVVDGGRPDEAPVSQDDEDALDALADIIAGSEPDPGTAARAREVARDIMGLPGDTSTGLRPADGPPAG